MLSLLILLIILGIVSTSEQTKDTANIVKNETGDGRWNRQQQPMLPMYPDPSAAAAAAGYGYSPGYYLSYTYCYPPALCTNPQPTTIDQFYCSAQGSFALGSAEQPDKLMREFCRYAATANENSCNTCCKIAARHYSISADEVTGIIFTFDPNKPPVLNYSKSRQASYSRKKRFTDTATTGTKSTKPEKKMRGADEYSSPIGLKSLDDHISSSTDVPQCFCCAPNRSIHVF